MDERRLTTFFTVARERSFSRAAELLHISQPAVSQQIASLEHELGCALIERLRPSLQLTAAGRELMQRTRGLLASLAETRRSVTAAASEIGGQLRIAASLTIGEYMLSAALAELSARHPRVRVQMLVENSGRVVRDLLAGSADIGFVEGLHASAGVTLMPLSRDELVLVIRSDHPFVGHEAVTLEDLALQPLIVREKGSGTREVFEDCLRACGYTLDGMHVVMELSATEAIKEAVVAGAGVAILSRGAIGKEVRLQLLTARRVRGMPMWRDFCAATPRGAALLPAAQEFMRLAQATLAAADGEGGLAPWRVPSPAGREE